MDNLEIEGKQYISAKRAAREHSYTMDYVGQLIRGGKLIGKKVGRSWYVEQDSLTAYLGSLSGARQQHSEAPSEMGETQEREESIPDVKIETPEHVAISRLEESRSEIPSPIAQVASQKIESNGRTSYDYPMLRYVRDDEDSILPELSTPSREIKEEAPAAAETETHEVHINKIKAVSVAPASLPYRQEIRTRGTGRGAASPVRYQSLLPMVLGAAAVVLMLGIAGTSLLFSRTFNYDSVAASIQSGFSYSDLYTNLVSPR